jgi:nucleoside-diphosphate-sugar epimerase
MISVVGGSGFIGTYLCESLLEKNLQFEIIDKRSSSRFPDHTAIVDILNIDKLKTSLSGDTIVHLAAEHRDNVRPVTLYELVNVEGTRNLCECASIRGINRIVFTSSVAVYGKAGRGATEATVCEPNTEYGKTKLMAEHVLRNWQSERPEERTVVVIRPTVVFGAGNRGNVYNLFNQIALKRFIMIGDGRNRKSLAYVGNLVDFIMHIINHPPGLYVYNYVDLPDPTVGEVVSIARQILHGRDDVGLKIPVWLGLALGMFADFLSGLTNRVLPISELRVRKFVTESSYTSSAHSVSGFHARTELLAALRSTLEAEFHTTK